MLSPSEYLKLYRKENPRKPQKNEQLSIFEEDKPLVLPEFGLREGLTKDLIESKSTHPDWVKILTNEFE